MLTEAEKPRLKLTEEQRNFVVSVVPFIHQQANRLSGGLDPTNGALDRDDLFQEGAMGAIDAAIRFNGEKNVTFLTFGWLRIQGQIKDVLRESWSKKWKRDVVSLDRKAINDGKDGGRIGDTVSSGENIEEIVIRADEARTVAKALQSLSDGERKIIGLRYLGGMLWRQIAAEFGVSPTTIRRSHKEAIIKLRELLGENEDQT